MSANLQTDVTDTATKECPAVCWLHLCHQGRFRGILILREHDRQKSQQTRKKVLDYCSLLTTKNFGYLECQNRENS